MKQILLRLSLLSTLLFLSFQAESQENLQRKSRVYFAEVHRGLDYFARRQMAFRVSNELHEGTLIVRLLANQEKLQKLRDLGKDAKADELQQIIKESNLEFIDDFRTYYDFSDVIFTYGYLLPDYLDGITTDIFLDENLEIDPSIKLKEGPFYYFGGQSTPNFYLLDKNFYVIEQPAPYAILTSFRNSKSNSIRSKKKLRVGIGYLNKRLYHFHNRIYTPIDSDSQ